MQGSGIAFEDGNDWMCWLAGGTKLEELAGDPTAQEGYGKCEAYTQQLRPTRKDLGPNLASVVAL